MGRQKTPLSGVFGWGIPTGVLVAVTSFGTQHGYVIREFLTARFAIVLLSFVLVFGIGGIFVEAVLRYLLGLGSRKS